MKVLLVSPINRTYVIMPNIGLGYLAAALRKDSHEVKILHCAKERMSYPKYAEFLKKDKFDIVGFQVFSYDLDSVKEHARLLKSINPSACIVVGGPHPSSAPEHTMEYLKDIDFAFQGEAEAGFSRLINRLSANKQDALEDGDLEDIPGLVWRSKSGIKVNDRGYINNLDELGFPSWDLMDPREYPEAPHGAFARNFPVAPIIITRGCPFLCTFCAGHTISGRKVRRRSISHVMAEIDFLMDNYGVKEFNIEDENFTLHKDLVEEFCNEVLKRNIKISWNCPSGIRIDTLSKPLLALMEESGCYSFGIGIESGSQKMLDLFRKNLTVKKIEEQTAMLRYTKIKATGFFLLGYPGETAEDIKETIRFAKKLPLYRAQFNSFMPLPGSEVYGALKEKGLLGDLEWRHFFVHDVTYISEELSRKKLGRLRRKAYLEFYLRPKIMFKILGEIRSFRHLVYLFSRFLDSLK
jgi:radical SAM superfamily enzyme YgiQ (UPF0313 family)